MFKIKDRKFDVYEAKISMTIQDPYWFEQYGSEFDHEFFWSVSVTANEKEFDDFCWEPGASFDDLILPIRNWHDLENTIHEWKEPKGNFYVFEHENIYESRLVIGQRKGSKFKLNWKGLCDIHWDEEYSERVPFEIECEAEFTGLAANASEKDTDASVLDRVHRYIETENLKQCPIDYKTYKYQSGIGIAGSSFLPLIENRG